MVHLLTFLRARRVHIPEVRAHTLHNQRNLLSLNTKVTEIDSDDTQCEF